MPKARVVSIFNGAKVQAEIRARVALAVTETADTMYDKARELVPVRKVFKYRRRNVGSKLFAEQLAGGRQDVRTQSLEEALAESLQRRKLGLPSAFPTDAAGRRLPGSQSLVRTAQLTAGYRSVNRANTFGVTNREVIRVNGENRLGHLEPIYEERFRGIKGELVKEEIGHRVVIDTAAEALLSGRGRRELARATGKTLGGALRDSITKPILVNHGRWVSAYIQAGGENAKYAKYVEFGTRRSRAQPFMRPALAQGREIFVANLRSQLGR